MPARDYGVQSLFMCTVYIIIFIYISIYVFADLVVSSCVASSFRRGVVCVFDTLCLLMVLFVRVSFVLSSPLCFCVNECVIDPICFICCFFVVGVLVFHSLPYVLSSELMHVWCVMFFYLVMCLCSCVRSRFFCIVMLVCVCFLILFGSLVSQGNP